MSLQFIIDGYNIINHPLCVRTHKHSEAPQSNLLEFIRIRRLTGSLKNKVTVVFDGYPPSHTESYDDTDIMAVFSRKISADDKIKLMVEESSDRKNIIVVSDDAELRNIIKSLGARPLGVEEFIRTKEKPGARREDMIKPELSYGAMHKINQELRRIWLK